MTGRANQKARTRTAVLDAAIEILRMGREPTIPEAAERAQVSLATAYRYFGSADVLQAEASQEMLSFVTLNDEVGPAIDAAGEDVHARLEALVRTLGWRILTDPAPFRQQAKAGHERWFANQAGDAEPVQVRIGRRNQFIRQVIAPLEGQLSASDHERLFAALVVGFGTEAAISLTDVARLDVEDALEVMAVACRWILDGALVEARIGSRRRSRGRPETRRVQK